MTLLNYRTTYYRTTYCGTTYYGTTYYGTTYYGTTYYGTLLAVAEWQMCAALGKLNHQDSRVIKFAVAPNTLSMDSKSGDFGTCSGYSDAPCQMPWVGFANDDIYYLEVCLFSQVCANREQLFALGNGQNFVCRVDEPAFRELQVWLIDGESGR